MKKLIIFCLVLVMSLPLLLAAQSPDDITGTWYNGDKNSKIVIVKTKAGTYQGSVEWLKTPLDEAGKAKLDVKNPDKSLRSRPLKGMIVLTGLKAKGNDKFDGGKIYDPQSGNNYSCKAELKGANVLSLRGFIGVALVGRTDTWTRAK